MYQWFRVNIIAILIPSQSSIWISITASILDIRYPNTTSVIKTISTKKVIKITSTKKVIWDGKWTKVLVTKTSNEVYSLYWTALLWLQRYFKLLVLCLCSQTYICVAKEFNLNRFTDTEAK